MDRKRTKRMSNQEWVNLGSCLARRLSSVPPSRFELRHVGRINIELLAVVGEQLAHVASAR
jgi:hypothetical protein